MTERGGEGRLLPLVAGLYLPAFLILVAIVIASGRLGVPIGEFTRDPAATARFHPFLGILSHAGVLLWTGASAIALFTSWTLRSRGRRDDPVRFLATGAVLTGVLLLDDLFMLHESILPHYLGIAELSFQVGLVVALVLFLIRFRRVVLETSYSLLLLALAFLGLSLAADLAEAVYRLPEQLLAEDGLKFLGIVGWFGYFAHSSRRFLRANGGGSSPFRRPPSKRSDP